MRWSPFIFIVTEWMTNLWSHADWQLKESTVAGVYWLPHNSLICKGSKLVTLAMLKIISFPGEKDPKQKAKKE